MKRLLIRLDDITPDMNWENFEIIHAVFEKHNIKPIIGVVPDNRDQGLSVAPKRADFWEIIRKLQEQGWTIAQHGYRHTYVTKKSGLLKLNPFSEFAGVPYAEQKEKLTKGQEILHKHGICAKMFMAPGHTYDRNTLKALKELGFMSVTDGYSSSLYRYKGLIFIPCTLSKQKMPKNVDTVCLHINGMARAEFEELDRYIAEHRDLFCAVTDLISVPESEETGASKPEMIPRRSFAIALEERKNLFIRRLKRFTAENVIMQQYLERTDSKEASIKKRKRLLGLPGLAVHLLFHWKYK